MSDFEKCGSSDLRSSDPGINVGAGAGQLLRYFSTEKKTSFDSQQYKLSHLEIWRQDAGK